MTTRFNIIFCSIIYTLHFASAIAAEPAKSTLAFSLGNSSAPNACDSPWTLVADPGFECTEGNRVFRFAYNYNFTPAWGLEFSAGDISNSRGSGTTGGDPFTFQMKTTGISLAGIAFLHLGQKFSFFAKAGVARIVLKENVRKITAGITYNGISLNGVNTTDYEENGLTYGLGFQYDFNETFGIRFQYENFGKFDVYSKYGLTTPDPIQLSVISAGFVLLY